MSDRPDFPMMRALFGGPPTGEPVPVPKPTDIGRYIVKGGTSTSRWSAREFVLGPNDQWYRLRFEETDWDDIASGLFEGQELMPLVPYNETDK